MQAKENCTHKWAIESPKGPWSLGTCSKCKKQDAFRNSSDITGWNPSPDKERSNKTYGKYRIPTKKEFLSAISNEDKLNTNSAITKKEWLNYTILYKIQNDVTKLKLKIKTEGITE